MHSQDTSLVSEPRFCEQCGQSFVPLSVPHVSRECEQCGRTIHLAEPGEGGRGIRVRKGDTFTVPGDWLRFSLDPSKGTGRFFRPGVRWYVQRRMMGDLPRNLSDLDAALAKYVEAADSVLENSELLTGFDLEDTRDAEKAVELLEKDHEGSLEWWAMVMGGLAKQLEETLADGDANTVAFWALRLQAVRSMFVFVQDLEEHVWAGYKHAQQIYDVASAAARTPAEAEVIQALRPTFSNLPEDVLHSWVEAGVDIGPRISVSNVEEGLLKALAKYHLSLFERGRAEEELARQRQSDLRRNRIAAAGVGITATTAVVGVLKALGVL